MRKIHHVIIGFNIIRVIGRAGIQGGHGGEKTDGGMRTGGDYQSERAAKATFALEPSRQAEPNRSKVKPEFSSACSRDGFIPEARTTVRER
jgi:hypothetical protein